MSKALQNDSDQWRGFKLQVKQRAGVLPEMRRDTRQLGFSSCTSALSPRRQRWPDCGQGNGEGEDVTTETINLTVPLLDLLLWMWQGPLAAAKLGFLKIQWICLKNAAKEISLYNLHTIGKLFFS